MPQSVAVSRADNHAVDPTMLVKLRCYLCEERDAQRSQLADFHSTLDYISDQTDADSMLTREMTERSVVRGLAVIAEIEHALSCMTSGSYGVCERCDGAIPLARLEAIPYTRHCIGCPTKALLF